MVVACCKVEWRYNMSKKKSKKHSQKKNFKKQPLPKIWTDGVTIDVPYDEVLRKDISIITHAVDMLPENTTNKPMIFICFSEIPASNADGNPSAVIRKITEYLYVAVSKYPQILYHMVHSQRFDAKDLTNAATIVDFYSDYYSTVPGCRDFDDVIKDLCIYMNGKGKSYGEIFTYLMDNITYPISAPKPIRNFIFNDIPDINALAYAITFSFDFGRDYMHCCTEQKFEYDNYKFIITYDADSRNVNIVCEQTNSAPK